MREHIILPGDVAPARITFDDLVLDPLVALEAQAEWELKEDLFLAEFPNGCALDIGWYPEFDPAGEFGIALTQNPDSYEPFMRDGCRTIPELRRVVAQFVEVARNRKDRYLCSRDSTNADEVCTNDLVVDPVRPLTDQLERLGSDLFEAAFEIGGFVLTVDWMPPHDRDGQFVVRLLQSSGEWEGRARPLGLKAIRERKPETWKTIHERFARTLPELASAIEELSTIPKATAARVRRELGLT